jgi:hypothetical protein
MWDSMEGYRKSVKPKGEKKLKEDFLQHDRRILQLLEMRRAFLSEEVFMWGGRPSTERSKKFIEVLREQIQLAAPASGAPASKIIPQDSPKHQVHEEPDDVGHNKRPSEGEENGVKSGKRISSSRQKNPANA